MAPCRKPRTALLQPISIPRFSPPSKPPALLPGASPPKPAISPPLSHQRHLPSPCHFQILALFSLLHCSLRCRGKEGGHLGGAKRGGRERGKGGKGDKGGRLVCCLNWQWRDTIIDFLRMMVLRNPVLEVLVLERTGGVV